MNKIVLLSLSMICFIAISCGSHPNYMVVTCADCKQSARFNIGKSFVYRNSDIDTTLLLSEMRTYKYNNSKFINVIRKSVDSSSTVLRIDKEYHEYEDEVYVSLFCQYYNENIIKLYYVESCQAVWCWEMENATMIIHGAGADRVVEINATIKSVGFALSNLVQFPYNEMGGYDDVERHMDVKVLQSLKTEDILDTDG